MSKFSQKFHALNDRTKEIMTYIFFILAIIILVGTIAFSAFKLYSGFSNQEMPKVAEKTNTSFVLKEHEGKVAVFDMEENLLQTTSIPVNSLPELDKALLKGGIDIESETELKKALEDYE